MRDKDVYYDGKPRKGLLARALGSDFVRDYSRTTAVSLGILALWTSSSMADLSSHISDSNFIDNISIVEGNNENANAPIIELPASGNLLEKKVDLNQRNSIGEAIQKDSFYERLEEQIIRHEGFRNNVYRDTRGVLTVGIGTNLESGNARNKLARVGANYDSIVNGKAGLTRDQALVLAREDIKDSILTAKKLVRNYDFQPEDVKLILCDMAYNLGETKLKGFKKMLSAVERGDYRIAADEMRNSKWFNQVGNRSKYLSELMGSAARN